MIARSEIKDIIADSMKELMNKKALDRITVDDIAANCSISRRTFYNHFEDKYDVIGYIYRKYGDLYYYNDGKKFTWREACVNALMHMRNDKAFYMNAIYYQGQNSLLDVIFEDSFIHSLEVLGNINDETLQAEMIFKMRFFFYGLVKSGEEWIKSGMGTDPEKLADELISCMPQDLREYLR